MKRSIRQDLNGYLFIFPAFFCLLVFVIYPIIRCGYLSFFNWDMVTSDPVFIGLRNYKDLFSDSEFYQTLRQTLSYAGIIIPTTMILGFVLALMMSETSRINVVFRTIFFSPKVTSMVAISSVWLYIYHPQYGILNRLLQVVGIDPVRWLNDTHSALFAISIVAIWRTLGFCTVVYLGGIQNISAEVLEAAEVDGASILRKIWHIKIPLVSPTSFMLLVLTTIDTLKMFTSIEVLTQGGPAHSTQNLTVMLYDYAFGQYQMGYASAISMVLFGLILTINLLQMMLEEKVVYD